MLSAPGRLLVVDDEPQLLRMLSLYLGRLGYSVTTAETTDAAWRLVEADPAAFAVAVLDGSMSGMSMNDLALRMLRANPALRVLAASDFSYAGYGGGGVAPPAVAAAIAVRPSGGDDTLLLQGAIDHVAALPLRADGFRGAVLLRAGRYQVGGRLQVRSSGVVLRGQGEATIVAAGQGRRTLIEAGAAADPATGPAANIIDEAVPAGGRRLTLDNLGGLRAGDRVVITRPSTAACI